MRKLSIGVVTATLGLGLGCSSGSAGAGTGLTCDGGADASLTCDAGAGPALTCDWLAGDNCWKQTATAATACLPPTTETGALSADGRTCTYASGAVIDFATPLVLPLPNDPTWNFTISNGGQACLHYEDMTTGLKLVVGTETVTSKPSGVLGLTVTCPDGASYGNPNALQLLSCDADGGSFFGGLPGGAWSWTDTSVSFGLISTSSTSSTELLLFDCSK
jgi:hypothetical protein